MPLGARNRRSGAWLATRVVRALTLRDRLKGLLGRPGLEPGEALWLEPCSQVHTFFMAFPIDVLFVDGGGKVVRVVERLRPWRLSPWVWGARGVLELEAGASSGKVRAGDKVDFSQRHGHG